jgi:hypothetical protein
MSSNKSNNKSNKLSIKNKYEIIMKIKSGVKKDVILSEYKIKNYSNLNYLMKNETKIVNKYQSINDKLSDKVFKVSEAKHPKVEKALIL